jgi:hypothetical protein
MPKCLADADNRRYFDEFESVRVSRLRATGLIDPAKRHHRRSGTSAVPTSFCLSPKWMTA